MEDKKEKSPFCSVEGCVGKIKAKGYCGKHYHHIERYGCIRTHLRTTPNTILIREYFAEMIICNIKGEEIARTQFDIEDVELVRRHKWYLEKHKNNPSQYIKSKAGNIWLHRLLLNEPNNNGNVVDHRDCNGLNNRKYNLRRCSQMQNTWNRRGVKGVYMVQRYGKTKYLARLIANKVIVLDKKFSTIEEAIMARKEAERTYFGEFAYVDCEST